MSIAASGKRNEQELQAMEVAEEAREEKWNHPSFLAELFSGNFNFNLIYPFPEQKADDRKIGDEYVRKLFNFLLKNLNAHEVDKTGEIPDHVVAGLADLGAFGMKIPKEYGGLGLSQTNYNRAIAAVASYCSSTAVLLSAHQSIGVPQPLKIFGTPEQKKKWLPRLAAGEISAFALTEKEVGSDPAQMKTVATPSEDGKHWILNGEKLWTTNGPIADIIVVMAATPPKILPNGREKKQITAFIIEKDMPGYSVLHRCDFMGLKGIQNGVLKFENVKVPNENILWDVGKGLKLALITLNTGRLTLPAATTSAARVCFKVSKTWARERMQWGGSIGNHELSAQRLMVSAGSTYAMDAVSKLSSGLVDNGNSDIRIEASLAKLFCSGLGWRVVDQTLQLRGGRGYESVESLRARGEDAYPIERIMRDYRINTIIEGTSTIQRLFTAREALDKHLSLAGNLFNPKAGFGAKLATVFQCALFYLFWYPKQWLHFAIWPRFFSFGSWEAKYLRFVKRMSHKVARTLFHAMVLNGPKLEKKQVTLARVVDTNMNLFALAAVLSRYLTKKKAGKLGKEETELAKVTCAYLKQSAKSSYRQIEVLPTRSKIISISQSIMKGDMDWLEEDICDVVGLARPNLSRT